MSRSLFREQALSKSNDVDREELLLKPRWTFIYWTIAVTGIALLLLTYMMFVE